MTKNILNFQEQVERLKIKNIIFKDAEEELNAQKFLAKYNYLNITSLKYLYASGKNIEHEYLIPTQFEDLKNKYFELLKFETTIREAVLQFETEIKVHFTVFLLEFLKSENKDFKTFLNYLSNSEKLKKQFSTSWERSIHAYSENHQDWENDFHLLIKILTFGDFLRFLQSDYQVPQNRLYDIFMKTYMKNKDFKIWKNYSELVTIGILRNAICHKESIVTFLEKGDRSNNLKDRKRTLNYIYSFYYRNIEEECELKGNEFFYYEKLNGLNQGSWIMRFEDYKFGNKQERKFKNLEINL